jgi:hypothetical protein
LWEEAEAQEDRHAQEEEATAEEQAQEAYVAEIGVGPPVRML